jgi:hypothetical protein
MKKINFVFVFLLLTINVDVIIPHLIPEVNNGIGFCLFLMLAIMLGFASGIGGMAVNNYFKNQ